MTYLMDFLKDICVPITQTIAPFIAAWVVLKQVGKNHINSIEQLREKYRIDLSLDWFKDINKAANELADNLIVYSTFIRIYKVNFLTFLDTKNLSYLSQNQSEFIKLHGVYDDKLSNLVSIIEAKEIIYPKIDIFRMALVQLGREEINSFGTLNRNIIESLPVTEEEFLNLRKGKELNLELANQIRINSFLQSLNDNKSKSIIDSCDVAISTTEKISSIVHDLSVDLQNNLLSDIFPNKVELRRPGDKNLLILSSNSAYYSKLKTLILENKLIEKL